MPHSVVNKDDPYVEEPCWSFNGIRAGIDMEETVVIWLGRVGPRIENDRERLCDSGRGTDQVRNVRAVVRVVSQGYGPVERPALGHGEDETQVEQEPAQPPQESRHLPAGESCGR